jgi:transcriptional regulator with XRE-family HTH domain
VADERSAGPIDKRLGERVRARRLEIDMSQEQLAELLGVTFQQVQKYERGVNRIAASRLYDIAHALDMPVCRFFDGLLPRAKRRGDEEPNAIENALLVSGATELVRMYASLPSATLRKRVSELVRALVDGDDKK